MDLLNALAKKHFDWLAMAKKLGATYPDDIVQEMYIRLNQYVKDPDRIMFKHGEVNTLYVYFTIRNLVSDEKKEQKKDPVWLGLDTSGDVSLSSEYYERYMSDAVFLQQELQDLINIIQDEKDKWHWYDRDLFDVYFSDEEMTIRKLSEETKISVSSIFNTLKNAKQRIKEAIRKT